jgi:FtsZ-interacting cell division protein ZipA
LYRKEENAMYKTVMIIGVIVLAIGWIAYGIWDYKMRQEEKKRPKPRSERLRKTQSEVSDWAKQMAAFKKPTYKKPDQDDTPTQSE